MRYKQTKKSLFSFSDSLPNEDAACPLKPGMAQGGEEIWLGRLTKSECITACLKKKEDESAINGLTVHKQDNMLGCWCVKDKSSRDDNTNWMSCYLDEKADGESCERKTCLFSNLSRGMWCACGAGEGYFLLLLKYHFLLTFSLDSSIL